MTAICTYTEVFDFMGTGTAERTANSTMITGLIDRVSYGIEQFIGRKISAQSVTSLKVHDGHYCSIQGSLCFLNGIYYDIANISTLKDDTVTLTSGTDYVLRSPNIIERVNAWFSGVPLGLEITGTFGLVYNSGTVETPVWTPLPDIKQIVIEAVAIKSGLWAKNIEDGSGNQFAVIRQNLPQITINQLNSYRQPAL